MDAGVSKIGANAAQLAQDIQSLLAGAVSCAVYEEDAPRDSNGVITARLPYIVYTANFSAPENEAGVFTVDLYIDVWALNSYAACYEIATALDWLLDASVYTMSSGVLCCDRNGLVMNREEKDPEDERIRRMSGQYLIRFYPM